MNLFHLVVLVLLPLGFWPTPAAKAQAGGHTLYGDVRVDESKVSGLKPISLDIILYTEGRLIVARQPVSTAGRYHFNNVPTGRYDLVIEMEGQEVARVRADLSSPLIGDLRQDLFLEWKPLGPPSKPGVISAGDQYERSSANKVLFAKVRDAMGKKHYNQAAELLQQIVTADPRDFQAFTELADVHLLQKKLQDAENEYLRAIDLRPGFFPALLNLGRLEVTQEKYHVAIAVLARAIKARPESADANYFLGESYLQTKKGSLAVAYLNEAIRIDPLGMAEVHLRLAALYHGAGMKDKAVIEYEEFLKKKPDYPDKKKIAQYIIANKKH